MERKKGVEGGVEGRGKRRRERERAGSNMQTTVISQHPQTDWWTCKSKKKTSPQSKVQTSTCLLLASMQPQSCQPEHWIVLPNCLLLLLYGLRVTSREEEEESFSAALSVENEK